MLQLAPYLELFSPLKCLNLLLFFGNLMNLGLVVSYIWWVNSLVHLSLIFCWLISPDLMINFTFWTVQIDVIASLLSGRLVRERIGPAMLSAVQSQVIIILLVNSPHTYICVYISAYIYSYIYAFKYQMGAVETNFDEVQNIFDTGGCKGLTGDSVEKIPKITITSDNNVDACGERVSCSVCLQVGFVLLFFS